MEWCWNYKYFRFLVEFYFTLLTVIARWQWMFFQGGLSLVRVKTRTDKEVNLYLSPLSLKHFLPLFFLEIREAISMKFLSKKLQPFYSNARQQQLLFLWYDKFCTYENTEKYKNYLTCIFSGLKIFAANEVCE